MLIGSAFFASMGLITESLGDEYSFGWIAGIRSLIATIIAVGIALASRSKLVLWKPASLWMRSLAGCTAMLCLFFAMTHYDVAVVLSLSSMYPIWVAVLSWPLLGQKPSRDTWLALLVSTIGMLMIYSASTSWNKDAESPAHYMPHIALPLAVLAAMFSGIALLGLHRVKNVDSSAIVAHFSGVSTAISFAVWFVIPAQYLSKRLFSTSADSTSLLRLLAVGVTATLGQLFLTKAFAAGPPARVSVIGLSQVAFAATYKWFVEGRLPAVASVLGMFLVVGATMWVILRGQRATGEEPSTTRN